MEQPAPANAADLLTDTAAAARPAADTDAADTAAADTAAAARARPDTAPSAADTAAAARARPDTAPSAADTAAAARARPDTAPSAAARARPDTAPSAAARARPDTAPSVTAIHWVDRDRSLTYAEAVDAMARAAAVLAGFGVTPGGRVGLFAHPGLDYVVALLGTWRLQATAVVVDLADKDRFHDLMTAASPDAVVYTNDHFDYVRPTLAALRTARRGTVFAGMDGPQSGTVGWLDALSEAVPLTEPPAATTAASSVALTAPASAPAGATAGTTSAPGSAPADATTRTHAELIEAATTVAAQLDLSPEDSTLCPTPLAQPFHLEASILPALLRGATAGLLKSWQPEDAWEQMERNGTTVLCATPDHCEQLLEVSAARGRKPHALRAAVTTTPDPGLADRLRAHLHIDVHIGATAGPPPGPAPGAPPGPAPGLPPTAAQPADQGG